MLVKAVCTGSLLWCSSNFLFHNCDLLWQTASCSCLTVKVHTTLIRQKKDINHNTLESKNRNSAGVRSSRCAVILLTLTISKTRMILKALILVHGVILCWSISIVSVADLTSFTLSFTLVLISSSFSNHSTARLQHSQIVCSSLQCSKFDITWQTDTILQIQYWQKVVSATDTVQPV